MQQMVDKETIALNLRLGFVGSLINYGQINYCFAIIEKCSKY